MKRIFLIVLVAVIAGAGFAYWTFNKPHQDVRKMKPDHFISSSDLISLFSADAILADEKFSNSILQIDGLPSAVKEADGQFLISFDTGEDYIVLAYLSTDETTKLSAGKQVKLKCKYSGFIINDDDFMIPADVKIEQCYVQP